MQRTLTLMGLGLMALALALAGPSTAAPVQWTVGAGGNDHWYEAILVSAGITWTDANADAPTRWGNYGGYLATITSEAENTFVYNLVNKVSYPDFWVADNGPWLGGYQPTQSQSDPAVGWEWVSGEAWSYTSWAPSQPDDYLFPEDNAENYLEFYSYGGDPWDWNDLSNTGYATPAVVGYIVEYNGNPVPEASTCLLFGIGLAALAAVQWRRRKGE